VDAVAGWPPAVQPEGGSSGVIVVRSPSSIVSDSMTRTTELSSHEFGQSRIGRGEPMEAAILAARREVAVDRVRPVYDWPSFGPRRWPVSVSFPPIPSGSQALQGRLAQLGEHQLDKLGVTGSSPVPPISPP
jgi:hypothetical protein